MGAGHIPGRIHDIALIIDDLERSGRLTRITSSVDLNHDLAGLAAALEGQPRAVLFETVAGHEWPVLTGLYWSRDLLASLFQRPEATLPAHVADCIQSWQQSPVDPVIVPDGPVLEVTERDVDLGRIPVPVHAQKDGGPYFDAAVVIAKDPETGVRNASIQRFQVTGKDRLHINIDAGRHLGRYLDKAAETGSSLTFTLNCGVGPGLHFAAAAPAEAAPIDKDELGIASAFHGAPLELVKASNGHDDIVAHAMWALECEIIPGELAEEGPFAEVTGYYATVAPRPVVHVRKVHRRESPVFHTILSGVEVWNSVGLLGEANVLNLLQKQVPGITDVYMTHGGGGFYHCVVQISQQREGWSKQAILAAFAAFPPLKMVTVVDDDVDLRSAQDVEWAMATRLDPKTGIVTIDDSFGHGLNPSFPDYVGAKVGFDATKPFPATWAYERATYKPMTLDAVQMVQPEIVQNEKRTVPFQNGGERVAMTRRDIEAFEAELARPQPVDLAPVRGSRTSTPPADDATLGKPQAADLNPVRPAAPGAVSADPDQDLVRPQPADLTPIRAGDASPSATSAVAPSPGSGKSNNSDPDAWITRPAAIDLSVRPAVSLSQPSSTPSAAPAQDDPDAWITRPAAIDLTPRKAAGQPGKDAAAEPDDPDAWITRPMPADLNPGAGGNTPGATGKAEASPEAETSPVDADAWITRPAAVDLSPVTATAVRPETPPIEASAPETPVVSAQSQEPEAAPVEDEDAWLSRPSAANLEPVVQRSAAAIDGEAEQDKKPLARPAPGGLDPSIIEEVAAEADAVSAANVSSTETSDASSVVAGGMGEPVATADRDADEPDPAQPEAAASNNASSDDSRREEPPMRKSPTPPARPTASAERPAAPSLRRFTKPLEAKKPSKPVSGGSFFEPAPESSSDSSGGEGSGGLETQADKPASLVATTRTNREDLPRKIQPVGLPVSDKREVVRPSGFFDSTPTPTKPLKKITRRIAKATGSPKLRSAVKPPKSDDGGGFFGDD